MDAKYASFFYLASIGEIEVVRKFIAQGVDVNFKDCDGNAAIHKVAEANRIEVMKLLLENGVDINAVNGSGNTALHVAILSNSLECVEVLLKNKIKVNRLNNEMCSEFLCAMQAESIANINAEELNSRRKIIELLINEENIDLRCTSSDARKIFDGGRNYLIYAIQNGY
ncbi:LmrCD-specific DARPin-like protein, partial [Leptotrombidium deliense]